MEQSSRVDTSKIIQRFLKRLPVFSLCKIEISALKPRGSLLKAKKLGKQIKKGISLWANSRLSLRGFRPVLSQKYLPF
jgi:hypothetical protein